MIGLRDYVAGAFEALSWIRSKLEDKEDPERILTEINSEIEKILYVSARDFPLRIDIQWEGDKNMSQEVEKITILIPVDIMNFFRALEQFGNFNIQEYLEECVASSLEADLYNAEFCTMISPEDIDKKYNVEKWLTGNLRNIVGMS